MKYDKLVDLHRLIRPMGGGEEREPGPSEEKW
jgi:hypothetical protein